LCRYATVMIWDDHQSRCIGELSFRVEVRAVRLRRDKIVVVGLYKLNSVRAVDNQGLSRAFNS
jgi:hypothetical protein